jgi:hypothetical protein
MNEQSIYELARRENLDRMQRLSSRRAYPRRPLRPRAGQLPVQQRGRMGE